MPGHTWSQQADRLSRSGCHRRKLLDSVAPSPSENGSIRIAFVIRMVLVYQETTVAFRSQKTRLYCRPRECTGFDYEGATLHLCTGCVRACMRAFVLSRAFGRVLVSPSHESASMGKDCSTTRLIVYCSPLSLFLWKKYSSTRPGSFTSALSPHLISWADVPTDVFRFATAALYAV